MAADGLGPAAQDGLEPGGQVLVSSGCGTRGTPAASSASRCHRACRVCNRSPNMPAIAVANSRTGSGAARVGESVPSIGSSLRCPRAAPTPGLTGADQLRSLFSISRDFFSPVEAFWGDLRRTAATSRSPWQTRQRLRTGDPRLLAAGPPSRHLRYRVLSVADLFLTTDMLDLRGKGCADSNPSVAKCAGRFGRIVTFATERPFFHFHPYYATVASSVDGTI